MHRRPGLTPLVSLLAVATLALAGCDTGDGAPVPSLTRTSTGTAAAPVPGDGSADTATATTAVAADPAASSAPGDATASTTEGAASTSDEAAVTSAGSTGAADTPTVDADPQPLPYRTDQHLADDVSAEELRSLILDGRLPQAFAGGALGIMLTSLAQRPAADVVILGDSMAQQGVEPAVLGDLLSRRAGREVTVFNAATGRARWGVNRLVVEDMIALGKTPDVVLMMVSTRAAESDFYYETTIQHLSLSSVLQGCDRPAAPTWTAEDARSCQADRDDLRHRFARAGGEVEWVRTGHDLPTSAELASGSTLRPDGYLSHPRTTLAKLDMLSRKRVLRGFPGWPVLQEPAARDFAAIVKRLRAHGVTVLSVEIPYPTLHQQRLERTWPGYDARRQQAAAGLAAAGGTRHFPVRAFDGWMQDGDVRDTIHLAQPGAAKFSRQLVQDVPGLADAIIAGLR